MRTCVCASLGESIEWVTSDFPRFGAMHCYTMQGPSHATDPETTSNRKFIAVYVALVVKEFFEKGRHIGNIETRNCSFRDMLLSIFAPDAGHSVAKGDICSELVLVVSSASPLVSGSIAKLVAVGGSEVVEDSRTTRA